MLNVKEKAFDFKLMSSEGNEISLHAYLGKKVIVYFYPKDNTPGCTKEACAFKSSFDAFRKNDIIVIGISKDSIASHLKFIEKYDLPFLLLSDPDFIAMQGFGVWKEKKLYGKSFMGVMRSTFIIDEAGFVEKVFEKANPTTNAQEILDYLNA
ncbi:MAG: thioredoxin-dependent thiol peroxidase [Erysipelotrichaceae bacterium]